MDACEFPQPDSKRVHGRLSCELVTEKSHTGYKYQVQYCYVAIENPKILPKVENSSSVERFGWVSNDLQGSKLGIFRTL